MWRDPAELANAMIKHGICKLRKGVGKCANFFTFQELYDLTVRYARESLRGSVGPPLSILAHAPVANPRDFVTLASHKLGGLFESREPSAWLTPLPDALKLAETALGDSFSTKYFRDTLVRHLGNSAHCTHTDTWAVALTRILPSVAYSRGMWASAQPKRLASDLLAAVNAENSRLVRLAQNINAETNSSMSLSLLKQGGIGSAGGAVQRRSRCPNLLARFSWRGPPLPTRLGSSIRWCSSRYFTTTQV